METMVAGGRPPTRQLSDDPHRHAHNLQRAASATEARPPPPPPPLLMARSHGRAMPSERPRRRHRQSRHRRGPRVRRSARLHGLHGRLNAPSGGVVSRRRHLRPLLLPSPPRLRLRFRMIYCLLPRHAPRRRRRRLHPRGLEPRPRQAPRWPPVQLQRPRPRVAAVMTMVATGAMARAAA